MIESGSEPPEYLLQHDPANLTIAELMDIMRRPDAEQSLMEGRVNSVAAVDALLNRMELGVQEHLEGLTLRELVLEDPPDILTRA